MLAAKTKMRHICFIARLRRSQKPFRVAPTIPYSSQACLYSSAIPSQLSALRRNTVKLKLASLPIDSVDVLLLAHSQGAIGWGNFLEGKMSNQFAVVQHAHLLMVPSIWACLDWTRQLIDKLLFLHLTHGQWIYRNILKNNKTHGLLKSAKSQQLLCEIDW
jgi:hypothetical protein